MFLPAFTSENKSQEQTAINAARSEAWLQPRRTSMDAVIVEERAQPALPTAFMSAEKRGGGVPVGRLPSAYGMSVRSPDQL